MGKGFFGSLFDFNHDGNMDVFEKSSELLFLDHIATASDTTEREDTDLDIDDLMLMDDDERIQALEDAGLDPMDFDLDDFDD